MPSVPLPLTFHLELELGPALACRGGHLQVFQLLHDLGQLPPHKVDSVPSCSRLAGRTKKWQP